MKTIVKSPNKIGDFLFGGQMLNFIKGAPGTIQSVNPNNYTARVKLDDHDEQITDELQILTPLSLGNTRKCIPKVNTPCFVIFVGDDTDRGFVIGMFFTDDNPGNTSEGVYDLNFQNSKVTINEDGNIVIDANLTSITSRVNITGNTTINGNLTVSGAIVGGSTISAASGLKVGSLEVSTHKHDQDGGGTTAGPKN